jgi:hypothetical protein
MDLLHRLMIQRTSSAFLLSILLLSVTTFASGNGKRYTLRKTSTALRIDGVVDAAWSAADSVSDFVQYQPFHGQTPTKRTVAKVLTTDEALYCLMICYDDAANIQRNTGMLDTQGGDIVSIMLDTFDDKRTAYKFAVSASGVRNDCRLLDDARDRDYSWDGVWFSAARIYEWGFVIEIQIPYRSIQYNPDLKEWGLDFDRWVPKGAQDIYWCAYEESEGQRISKFGRLVFEGFKPTVEGLNLEVYPVGIAKATYIGDGKYKIDPDAGLDIFYNPSQKLKFQLTANPDFAQIEADPFAFNITRYETYFDERRPFFIEGKEVFTPAGKQRNMGFYKPLELFYSRRIGKLLPDGSVVPLLFGSKAFGRSGSWEYGGFVAMTGERNFADGDVMHGEEQAFFGVGRINTQILENSSVGVLFAGKHTSNNDDGVIDIDGAFRTATTQLSYQIARSLGTQKGDFALSSGFTMITDDMLVGIRGRYIGNNFDVSQIGYVPWKGTATTTGFAGPRWYFKEGAVQTVSLYGGGTLNYEKVDGYTDHGLMLGYNMGFRSNWGFEVNLLWGKAKDEDAVYDCPEITLSAWWNTSPKWSFSLWSDVGRAYNFSRRWAALYAGNGCDFSWYALDVLQIGTSLSMYLEGNPSDGIEEITYNSRPYFSLTPINNLSIRMYVDNVFLRSTRRNERQIVGFLFSYNFSPKSWIYFAVNDLSDRSPVFDSSGRELPAALHVIDRVGVFKIRYLFYL